MPSAGISSTFTSGFTATRHTAAAATTASRLRSTRRRSSSRCSTRLISTSPGNASGAPLEGVRFSRIGVGGDSTVADPSPDGTGPGWGEVMAAG